MTCACGDGKLCAEHLGAWLNRPHPSKWGHDWRCASRDQQPCDCKPQPWRSFPAEPTCERCIVKVEGGYVMQRCMECRKGDADDVR